MTGSLDISDIRAIFTLLTLIAFLGVCLWAWSSRRKTEFEQTAQQPFSEQDETIHSRSAIGEWP